MDRIDRRTFLTTGIKAGAALAAVGLVSDALVHEVTANASTASGGSSAAPGPPIGLGTTGVAGSAGPVGVDPDDVQFAWQVADSRRGAVQGAYRVVVSGPNGSASTVWDSSEVALGSTGLRALRGTTTGRRHQLPVDGQDGGRPRRLERGQRPCHLHHRAAPGGLDRPVGADRGPPTPVSRTIPTCARFEPFRLGPSSGPRPTSPPPTSTACGSTVARLDTGPSFCFPDEQYYQATDITSAVVAGRANAFGVLHHWYGPGRAVPPRPRASWLR